MFKLLSTYAQSVSRFYNGMSKRKKGKVVTLRYRSKLLRQLVLRCNQEGVEVTPEQVLKVVCRRVAQEDDWENNFDVWVDNAMTHFLDCNVCFQVFLYDLQRQLS